MALKSKWIKSMNDFLCGLLFLGLGCYLLFSQNILQGEFDRDPLGGILVRADTYVRMLGIIMTFLSVVMIIRTINFKRTETEGLKFALSAASVATIVALFLYTLFLDLIGFVISTFVLSFFLVFFYAWKEQHGIPKEKMLRFIIVNTIFSGVLLAAVYFIFTELLNVSLP